MSKKDQAYQWWKRKPTSVRKPLVLTFGMLLVIISPFTGILPGPGGIPIFLLGIAILASEYDWADRMKQFFLNVLPEWIKRYWRFTPKWLYFFDFVAFCILLLALALTVWPVYLPILEMRAEVPFFFVAVDQHQQWWIPAAVCLAASISLFIFNRNRIQALKKLLHKLKRSRIIKQI